MVPVRLLPVLVVLPLLAGCGDEKKPPGPISAVKLSQNWKKVTGDQLQIESSYKGPTRLALRQDRYETYGIFTAYVTKSAAGRRKVLGELGRSRRGPGRGIRWTQDDTGRSWSATRIYRNVIVTVSAGRARRLTPALERLDRTVRAAIAGDPERIPVAERPCARQGIDPLGTGKAGRCREGDVLLSVGSSRTRVATPDYTAKLVAVRSLRAVAGTSSYADPDIAAGRFVIVSFDLAARGSRPVQMRPKLLLDGREYEEAIIGTDLYGDENDPLPLTPGDRARVRVAFDLPAPAAARAARDGVLVLPAERYPEDPDGALFDDGAQARIRLAGAPEREAGAPRQAPTGAQLARGRERLAVIATVQRLFRAVRRRDAPAFCALLTRETLLANGGLGRCRRSARVKRSAARFAPPAGERLTINASVSGGTALVTVLTPTYRAGYGLVKQGGRWRVRRFQRLR